MHTNLPPMYFEAEKRFREAKTSEDKAEALEEMLTIMPKHRGTDNTIKTCFLGSKRKSSGGRVNSKRSAGTGTKNTTNCLSGLSLLKILE